MEKCLCCCCLPQVAGRCFFTGVHNHELYPTFVRVTGRAGRRYAKLFDALSNEFHWRKLVIFINDHDQSAAEMAGYIKKVAVNLYVRLDHVRQGEKRPFLHKLTDIIEENSEAGYVRVILSIFFYFYRAMLRIRGTSHSPVSVCLSVCLSVRPSVTSRSSSKTAKRRITQTTPHDSPGSLVF